MQKAIDSTQRRRAIQLAYNEKHNIVPKQIIKTVEDPILSRTEQGEYTSGEDEKMIASETKTAYRTADDIENQIKILTKRMKKAAKELNFIEAAQLRDEIEALKKTSGNQ